MHESGSRCGFRLYIQTEADIADAVRHARQAALAIGFNSVEGSYIATAAAELASNLLIHAGGGVFVVEQREDGIELLASDCGPGIPDIAMAMREGYSTAGGLGSGLPGIGRLMDGLEIESEPGTGTRVRAWRQRRS